MDINTPFGWHHILCFGKNIFGIEEVTNMPFRKEKEINKLILKHLDSVCSCLQLSLETVQEYLNDHIEEAKALALKVDRSETEADVILREIMSKLYAGAYLPSLRSDIFHLVQRMDGIANAAEACCDVFLDQRPDIPTKLRPHFRSIMEKSISSCTPLMEALRSFLKNEDPSTIQENARQVGIKESDVDKEEWDITRDIFKTDLDYGHKIHLKQCLESIVTISDRAEDTSDQLQLIIIKGGL
jgi:predicted phosphate transport protein (TIGR00153 family)